MAIVPSVLVVSAPAIPTEQPAFRKAFGRPPKLTPQLITSIANYIRQGNYLETAAAANGVSRVSVHNWLKRGAEHSKGLHREFLDAVNKAQAQAEIFDVSRISAAALAGQWKASAWRLQRRFPSRWGVPDMATPPSAPAEPGSVSVGDGATVIVITGSKSDYIAKLRAARDAVQALPLPSPSNGNGNGNGDGNGNGNGTH